MWSCAHVGMWPWNAFVVVAAMLVGSEDIDRTIMFTWTHEHMDT